MIIIETLAYFAAFIFLCITYFYLTTAAVTIGTTAALKAWMIESGISFTSGLDAEETFCLDESDPEQAKILRNIRGEN